MNPCERCGKQTERRRRILFFLFCPKCRALWTTKWKKFKKGLAKLNIQVGTPEFGKQFGRALHLFARHYHKTTTAKSGLTPVEISDAIWEALHKKKRG